MCDLGFCFFLHLNYVCRVLPVYRVFISLSTTVKISHVVYSLTVFYV